MEIVWSWGPFALRHLFSLRRVEICLDACPQTLAMEALGSPWEIFPANELSAPALSIVKESARQATRVDMWVPWVSAYGVERAFT